MTMATNMRDLGGYAASDGRITQFGRLFRSDCPSSFSEEDVAWIRRLGIRTAIDLRSIGECEVMPSAYASLSGIAYHPCPFAGGAEAPAREEDIPGSYLALCSDRQNMRRVFSCIASAEGGVVFHCQAGKDRTGVVAALLLTLAGVGVADVLADYQISNTHLRAFLQEQRARHREMPSWVGRSESWYMERMLDALLSEYHGIGGYFDRLGLDAEQQRCLQQRLLG